MSPIPQKTLVLNRLPWTIAAFGVLLLVAAVLGQRDQGRANGTAALQARPSAAEFPGPTEMASASGTPALQTGGFDSHYQQRSDMASKQQITDHRPQLSALESQFDRDGTDPVKGGQNNRTLAQAISNSTR